MTLDIEGNVSVTDTTRHARSPTLTEGAPGEYELRVSTVIAGGPPAACSAGHVPYEATPVLPHGGLGEFRLTVVHDSDPVAT